MAQISKEEKLKKIKEQIQNEKDSIAKSKQRIKEFSAKQKILEQQIAEEKYKLLQEVLKEYGISSVDDFQNFIDNYSDNGTAVEAENKKSEDNNENSDFS